MKNKRGSTIAIVIIFTVMVALVISSVVGLIAVQRRVAVMRELQIQANNLAETALDYAFSYVATDIKAVGLAGTAYIPATGAPAVHFNFSTDASSFLRGSIAAAADFATPTSQVTFSTMEVRILSAGNPVSYLISAQDPSEAMGSFANQRITETQVPILAKVTANQGKYSYTTYIQKNIALREIPMFQKAIAYEGQLHLHRGYPIMGGVHTNSHLVINAHDGDVATYNGMVTCAGHFYRGSAFDQGGTGADPYGYCPVTATDPNTGLDAIDFAANYSENVSLAATNSTTLKIISSDPTVTPATYALLTSGISSRMTNWKATAITTFKGNLMDSAHGVPALRPPGVTAYKMDVATTTSTNEFNNGTYGLLEPNVPSSHQAYKPLNIYQFSRACQLLLRVELMVQMPKTPNSASGRSAAPYDTTDSKNWIVKAYAHVRTPTSDTLVPLPMPEGLIGQTQIGVSTTPNNQYSIAHPSNYRNAANTASFEDPAAKGAIIEGLFEEFVMDTTTTPYTVKNAGTSPSGDTLPASGFFDCRMGRGVSPVTINVRRLKDIIDGTTVTPSLAETVFRNTLLSAGYKGLIYVEFPTSLTPDITTSPRATYPSGAKVNQPFAYYDFDGDGKLDGDVTAVDSWPFQYGTCELRHPDRWADTDNAGRANRNDHILPIAPGLRGYPATQANAEIAKGKWAIPALQIVNARALPQTGLGLTISTNAPIYLVGSFNADGNLATGTNILGTTPTSFAVADPDTDTTMAGIQREVPAGLFCEYMTILSDNWGVGGRTGIRFTKSFDGSANSSTGTRRVTSGPVEISACIIAGEYPIFEFFFHALEDWENYYGGTYKSPIVIKGAVVGMFHSEIQHIKQAYSRNQSNDIQVYYTGHGAFAIPAVRMHQNIMNGTYPPGTPMAHDYSQNSFKFMSPGSVDQATLTAAGF